MKKKPEFRYFLKKVFSSRSNFYCELNQLNGIINAIDGEIYLFTKSHKSSGLFNSRAANEEGKLLI